MKKSRMLLVISMAVLLVGTVTVSLKLSSNYSLHSLLARWDCPRNVQTVPLTLWVWEGKQDMNFLADKRFHVADARYARTKVAYYAGTIYLVDGFSLLKPRLSALKLAPDQMACPVFRIENRHPEQAPSADSALRVAEIIQRHLARFPSQSIQIDYDATACEREFYVTLIKQLRTALPKETHIEITALASWCLDDRWLSRLPADEAIVMLFSMGHERGEILRLLEKRHLESGSSMPLSIGISANEPATNARLRKIGILSSASQIYVFNSLSWTPKRFEDFAKEVLQP